MVGAGPTDRNVAVGAQRRCLIRLHQEVAVLIVVGIMTGRALETPRLIQLDRSVQQRGVYELSVLCVQPLIEGEGDRMVIGQISPDMCRACRESPAARREQNFVRAASDHAKRHGSVVAAEAEFGGARGLTR